MTTTISQRMLQKLGSFSGDIIPDNSSITEALEALEAAIALGGGNSPIAVMVDRFVGDGAETVFKLTSNPGALNNLEVTLGGITQTPGEAYNWIRGLDVTFLTPPPSGEKVLIRYFTASDYKEGSIPRVDVYTTDGVETEYELSYNPGSLANLFVTIGGVDQTPGVSYHWDGENLLTFTSIPPADQKIVIRYFSTVSVLNVEAANVRTGSFIEGIIPTGVSVNEALQSLESNLKERATKTTATVITDGLLSAVDKSKLDGIATGATLNADDSALRDRSTHTGVQIIATVSGLQDALDDKASLDSPSFTGSVTVDGFSIENRSQRGVANGYAPLGADGKIPSVNLPDNGSYKGNWNANTNSPTIVAGTGSNGDTYTVSVAGTQSVTGAPVSFAVGDQIRFTTNGNKWERIPNSQAVASVAGLTGAIDPSALKTALTLVRADVGLANVNNTSDANKPISNAVQTALNLKASTALSTQGSAGLMSSADKLKVDTIPAATILNAAVAGQAINLFDYCTDDEQRAAVIAGNVGIDIPLAAAINAAELSGRAIFIPGRGTYKTSVNAVISNPKGVSIFGEGCTIKKVGTGSLFVTGAATDPIMAGARLVDGTVVAGSKSLKVRPGQQTQFSVGQWVVVTDRTRIYPVANNYRGELQLIQKIETEAGTNNGIITFWSPIKYDYLGGDVGGGYGRIVAAPLVEGTVYRDFNVVMDDTVDPATSGDIFVFDNRWLINPRFENIRISKFIKVGIFFKSCIGWIADNVHFNVGGSSDKGTDDPTSSEGLGGYSYGICEAGPCVGGRMSNCTSINIRHTYTTIALSPNNGNVVDYGEPTGTVVTNNTAIYPVNAAFDTHESGWGISFVNNKVIGGHFVGMQIRSRGSTVDGLEVIDTVGCALWIRGGATTANDNAYADETVWDNVVARRTNLGVSFDTTDWRERGAVCDEGRNTRGGTVYAFNTGGSAFMMYRNGGNQGGYVDRIVARNICQLATTNKYVAHIANTFAGEVSIKEIHSVSDGKVTNVIRGEGTSGIVRNTTVNSSGHTGATSLMSGGMTLRNGLSGITSLDGELTSIKTRLSQIVSVKDTDFGAVGNGINDDTASINLAISTVGAAGGGIVYLPAGTYLVSNSNLLATNWDNNRAIYIGYDNVVLMGAGAGATKIKLANNANCHVIKFGQRNATAKTIKFGGVRDLQVDGSRTNNANPGTSTNQFNLIDISTGCSDIGLEKLYLHDASFYAIGVQTDLFNRITIRDVSIERTGSDGIDFAGTSDSNVGNIIDNVTIVNWGMATNLPAGHVALDIRSGVRASNITIGTPGSSGALIGVRLQSGSVGTTPIQPSNIRAFRISGNNTALSIGVAVLTIFGRVTDGYVTGFEDGYSLSDPNARFGNLTSSNNVNGFRFWQNSGSSVIEADNGGMFGLISNDNTGTGMIVDSVDEMSFLGCDVRRNAVGWDIKSGSTNIRILSGSCVNNTTSIIDNGASTSISEVVGLRTRNIVSANVSITTTGIKTITIPHGLAVTPGPSDVVLSLRRSAAAATWQMGFLWVVSTDATNIVAEMNVIAASSTSGAVATVVATVQTKNA